MADAQSPAFGTREPVGRVGENRFSTPANQILTPAGLQVELPGMRPQALALSPDARMLVAAGTAGELVILDPASGRVLQRVPLPLEKDPNLPSPEIPARPAKPDIKGAVSYTGLVFSPDGSRIYLADVNGSIKVFGVARNRVVTGLFSFPLPPVDMPRRKAEIPAGLTLSPDGRRLYVCGNLSNRLFELDAAGGNVLRTWNVGVAPYDVVLAGRKAYVSNWGGRRPESADVTGPAGHTARVRVDPVRFIANEGSVSVLDLRAGGGSAAGSPKSEILVGLHASAMALSPNRRHLVVANAAADTVSVINTRTDEVVETIWTRQSPADLFGAAPNALAFDKSGRQLFVCNGTQNAVAAIAFEPGQSKLRGLIPVGWFPGAIAHDAARRTLWVANIKGIGSTKRYPPEAKASYNTYQYFGTLSRVPVPTAPELAAHTRTALANLRYPLLAEAALPARPGEPPRPVPERVGEPSVFRHVVYIIKENRTYDQVFGDVKEGNGDPSLCVFGERITPNQHKLAREFVLLDNTYCSGVLSADGHQWTDTAITTDYVEKSFPTFPRSYPDGMGDREVDALAYSPAGFIWDNALAHGKTLRDYGEFAITRKAWKDPARPGQPTFLDHYREFLAGTDTIRLWSEPAIESLRPYLVTTTVGWDLDVPDVFRAAQFIKELRQFERTGDFPNLVIICLPNNHTSGTNAGSPTPAASVADNDLAFGQIIEAIGRSRFWKETCVFAIEDDPQDGWDHVSGYRTAALVVSPYTRRGEVVGTQYNHTSVLRTLELILGLPPMNQMDATATPMSDCFTAVPDFTPFTAVANNVPLDQMNPEPVTISDPLVRRDAYASARLPLDRVDQCPEDVFNRILWRAMKGPRTPYPQWAVTDAVND